jgi:DinB superfamily
MARIISRFTLTFVVSKIKKYCKMKSILFVLCLLASSSAWAQKAFLTTEQRLFATDYLNKTKEEFLKSIEGLTNEQLTFRNKKDKWCILDCAEHITLAEQTLANVVKKQLKEPADSLKTSHLKMTEKKIITRLNFRLVKVKSPEIIKPSGHFENIEAIKKAFITQRDSTINFVNTTNDPLHFHFWKHPATGTIDLYQTIILMSAHTKRHILQIEEVKRASKFPKTSKAVKYTLN